MEVKSAATTITTAAANSRQQPLKNLISRKSELQFHVTELAESPNSVACTKVDAVRSLSQSFEVSKGF